jgi:uncharacterized damage-inducible protein DinB
MRTLALGLLLTSGAFAQQSNARASIERHLASVEKEITGIAEAMPAGQYAFVPANGAFRGVRNFANQIKHAAAVHYVIGAILLGEQPPADAADERGPDKLKTKAEVMGYLKDSFAYLRRGLATITDENAFQNIKNPFGSAPETRTGLMMIVIGHTSNHYGQVVEYLRMTGNTPR